MLRVFIITLMAFAGLSRAALALSPPLQPCELVLDGYGDEIRWVESTVQDGAVLVTALSQPDELYRYTFEDCRSGRHMRVLLNDAQSMDWKGHREPVENAFRQAVASSRSYTMRSLRAAFRKAGYKTQLNTSASESCGCNAYYPELRGSKKLYEATQ